jgi:hypothetical protein
MGPLTLAGKAGDLLAGRRLPAAGVRIWCEAIL